MDVETNETGLTLVEVLVAVAITAVVAGGVTAVLINSLQSASRDRERTIAVLLATERLEQLRSLTWGVGDAASPAIVSDSTTDLSFPTPQPGGPGLSPSSSSALIANVPGLVDHLDEVGRWVGRGPGVPGARFTRRWRVSRVPGLGDALVLEVAVWRASDTATSNPLVRLATIKTRQGGLS